VIIEQPTTSLAVVVLNNTADSSSRDLFSFGATPESALSSSPGALALVDDSGAGEMYLKVSGSATNTGWEKVLTGSPTASAPRQFAQVVVNTTITGGAGDATSDINSGKLSSGTLPARDSNLDFDTQAMIYINGSLAFNGAANEVFASPAANTDIRLGSGVNLVSSDVITIVYYNY
jgi:hypothetical protein